MFNLHDLDWEDVGSRALVEQARHEFPNGYFVHISRYKGETLATFLNGKIYGLRLGMRVLAGGVEPHYLSDIILAKNGMAVEQTFITSDAVETCMEAVGKLPHVSLLRHMAENLEAVCQHHRQSV